MTSSNTITSARSKLEALEAALDSDQLSHAAKLVFARLLTFHNTENGRCDPRVETIAERLGYCRRLVLKAIAELKAGGWLTTKKRRGSAVFTLNFERGASSANASKANQIPEEEVHGHARLKPKGVNADAHQQADEVHAGAHVEVHPSAHLREHGNFEHEEKEVGVERASAQPRPKLRPLPEDWSPSHADLFFAQQRGLAEWEIGRSILRFRNHHRSNGGTKADWGLAWRNWVMDDADRKAAASVQHGGQSLGVASAMNGLMHHAAMMHGGQIQ